MKTFILHLTVDDRDAAEVSEILSSEDGLDLLLNTVNLEMGGLFGGEIDVPRMELVYDATKDLNA